MGAIEKEYGLLMYSIEEKEITIDWLEVSKLRCGYGTMLLNEIKVIAKELNLPISLYSFPLNNKLSESELRVFYNKNGFTQNPKDSDENYLIYA